MSQVLDPKMRMEKAAHEKEGRKNVARHITEREMFVKSVFSPLIGRKCEEFY